MLRAAPPSIGLVVVIGLLAHSGPIAAPTAVGVPSPANSEVPRCIISCPAGDTEYRIVVRDGLNNPGSGNCGFYTHVLNRGGRGVRSPLDSVL